MKYRKKPVVIDAWTAKEISAAMAQDWNKGLIPEAIMDAYEKGGWVFLPNGEIHIPTLEGTMIAGKEDMILMGVGGEFYPCKPDIFEKTYEKVEQNETNIRLFKAQKARRTSLATFRKIRRTNGGKSIAQRHGKFCSCKMERRFSYARCGF